MFEFINVVVCAKSFFSMGEGPQASLLFSNAKSLTPGLCVKPLLFDKFDRMAALVSRSNRFIDDHTKNSLRFLCRFTHRHHVLLHKLASRDCNLLWRFFCMIYSKMFQCSFCRLSRYHLPRVLTNIKSSKSFLSFTGHKEYKVRLSIYLANSFITFFFHLFIFE